MSTIVRTVLGTLDNTAFSINVGPKLHFTSEQLLIPFSFFFRWLLGFRAVWRCCLTSGMCTALQVSCRVLKSCEKALESVHLDLKIVWCNSNTYFWWRWSVSVILLTLLYKLDLPCSWTEAWINLFKLVFNRLIKFASDLSFFLSSVSFFFLFFFKLVAGTKNVLIEVSF